MIIHTSSTDTKELQWYDVLTTKVFVRYKTEKQVKIGLLYSKFMALWWESLYRFFEEHKYTIIIISFVSSSRRRTNEEP